MRYLRVLLMGTLLGINLYGNAGLTWAGQLERVSVNAKEVQGDRGSFSPVLSANGRIVAFDSDARNLVDNDGDGVFTDDDTNGNADVFVYNRKTKQLLMVSVNSSEVQGEQESFAPAISADGQIVAFESLATNLALPTLDTNLVRDIFVRDLTLGETTRVSVVDPTVKEDDEESNGASFAPAISADGRFVAFASFATNLVEGDNNGFLDIFVHDRETKQTTRVSVAHLTGVESTGASFAPTISADGRFVAFESTADNLVVGDANGASDIFRHDRLTGETRLVSVGVTEDQGLAGSFAPSISANGCLIAFESFASNLNPIGDPDRNGVRDVFLYNCKSRTSHRVSISTSGQEGHGASFAPTIAAKGQVVAFVSVATNLDTEIPHANGSAHIFRHNVKTEETTRLSVNAAKEQGNLGSFAPALSANGRVIAFDSDATNLVDEDEDELFDDDTNGVADVFVK